MFEVSFRARPEHVDLWQSIFELLETGSSGALLQDKMETFGRAVDQKLEAIFDEHGVEGVFMLQEWECDGDRFYALFESTDIQYIQDVHELFKLCPIATLDVERDEETDFE